MNLKNILNGWENFIEKSEVTEQLAKERAKECVKCPYLRDGLITAFIKDKLKEIQGTYCNKCKCPTSAKIRSINETCPINKW